MDRLKRLLEKITHLTNVQIQTSQQIQELKDIILQMSRGNQAVTVSFTALLEADTAAQSIDSILADNKGPEPGYEMPAAQLPVLDANQVFVAKYMPPPPAADILVESVDSLLAEDGAQEPGQEMSAAQVPMDEVYDDLEHTIRT